MARRRKGVMGNVLGFVAQARAAAGKALQTLRNEINATRKRLETLIAEERRFRLDLFGTGGPGRSRRIGRPPGKRSAVKKAQPRRRRPAKAEKFFAKLPQKFTIDDVRKVAGRLSGVSLAQWSRAKRIKKTAGGYQKTA